MDEIQEEIKKLLSYFDQNWVQYEMVYVLELMEIESKARSYIQKAISLDRELEAFESSAK